MENIYLSGHFAILDYCISHSILLLRATEVTEETHINTDILFEATYYLEIPNRMSDVSIEYGSDADREYVKGKFSQEYANTIMPYDIYVLKTGNKLFYIGAGRMTITQNSYDPLETSIGLKRKD